MLSPSALSATTQQSFTLDSYFDHRPFSPPPPSSPTSLPRHPRPRPRQTRSLPATPSPASPVLTPTRPKTPLSFASFQLSSPVSPSTPPRPITRSSTLTALSGTSSTSSTTSISFFQVHNRLSPRPELFRIVAGTSSLYVPSIKELPSPTRYDPVNKVAYADSFTSPGRISDYTLPSTPGGTSENFKLAGTDTPSGYLFPTIHEEDELRELRRDYIYPDSDYEDDDGWYFRRSRAASPIPLNRFNMPSSVTSEQSERSATLATSPISGEKQSRFNTPSSITSERLVRTPSLSADRRSIRSVSLEPSQLEAMMKANNMHSAFSTPTRPQSSAGMSSTTSMSGDMRSRSGSPDLYWGTDGDGLHVSKTRSGRVCINSNLSLFFSPFFFLPVLLRSAPSLVFPFV